MSFVALKRGWDAGISHIARDHPFCPRMAWHWLIENAAHSEHMRRGAAGHCQVNRGELAFSWRSLATAWGWERINCRRYVARLEQEGLVSTFRAGRQQVMVIKGYDAYLAGSP